MPILVHDLPGRMRFAVTGLKGDPAHGQRLEALIGALPGVISARANAVTGSLLVEHDAAPARRGVIMAAMDEASRSVSLHARSGRSLPPMLGAIAQGIVETLIERALHAAVAAM